MVCSMPLRLCLCGGRETKLLELARQVDSIAEIGKELWRKLFLDVESESDLVSWEARIPNYDCKCRDFYDAWKADHPPIWIDGKLAFEWKWSLKSAVNQKLGHTDLSLDDARRFWQGS